MDLLEWMSDLIQNFGQKIAKVLPTSPFKDFIDNFATPQYMGWLNWFFPVSQLLAVVTVWLSAIAVFYLYSILMRWVKMIGD